MGMLSNFYQCSHLNTTVDRITLLDIHSTWNMILSTLPYGFVYGLVLPHTNLQNSYVHSKFPLWNLYIDWYSRINICILETNMIIYQSKPMVYCCVLWSWAFNQQIWLYHFKTNFIQLQYLQKWLITVDNIYNE